MNIKAHRCHSKRSNFMSKAAVWLKVHGFEGITVFRTVRPRFWDWSYRRKAAKARRRAGKVRVLS